MANFADGYLQRGAPLGAAYSTVYLTADNTAVPTQGVSMILVGSDSATATSRTFTLAASNLVGHELSLIFNTGSSTTAQLADSGGQKLLGDWLPTQYDVLKLVSDGTNWIELARSNVSENLQDIPLASGKILVGSSGGLAAAVTMSSDATIANTGALTIANSAITNAKVSASAAIAYSKLTLTGSVLEADLSTSAAAGLQVQRFAYGVFNPSAVSGDRTIAAHTLGATIPSNSFVTGVWYWVETTFTSATDAATIALSIQAANDVTTATAISAGGDIWDTTAKPVEGTTVIETTSTWLKTTATRALTATVGGEVLTAGKLHLWARYFTYA